MKNLYVHIGFPRTATTTLQLKLFKNHKDLNYLGRFPNRNLAHHKTIHNILYYSDQEFTKNFKKISDEIKNLPLSSIKTNLISDEFFLLRDLLHQKIFIKDSIQRLNKICRLNNINLKIIYSVRNQLDIIRSLFQVTFLTTLKTEYSRIILSMNEIETDNYTNHFLKGFNYNFLHETLSKIIGSHNLHVIFYEKLVVCREEYCEEISKILNLSYIETSKLLNNARLHRVNDQINVDSKFSTKLQLIQFHLKNLSLDNILSKDFTTKLISFFKKKIFLNKIDKKKIIQNREILDKAMIGFEENKDLIKKYFLESNKEFFRINNISKTIKNFYL